MNSLEIRWLVHGIMVVLVAPYCMYVAFAMISAGFSIPQSHSLLASFYWDRAVPRIAIYLLVAGFAMVFAVKAMPFSAKVLTMRSQPAGNAFIEIFLIPLLPVLYSTAIAYTAAYYMLEMTTAFTALFVLLPLLFYLFLYISRRKRFLKKYLAANAET